MDRIQIVKAYFAALDSDEMEKADQYLADDFQLADFAEKPLDRSGLLDLYRHLKVALPNLKHSLSNIRIEENLVKLTAQLAGTNSGHLDLRSLGIGVVPRSDRFIIFPNGNFEIGFRGDKIVLQRDVSPHSPNRRMSGMLKALGVNIAAY